MLDNGGEGSAATTAATPTAPRGVTLRAVRQVVTILEGRKKRRRLDGDGRRMTETHWFLPFPTLRRKAHGDSSIRAMGFSSTTVMRLK